MPTSAHPRGPRTEDPAETTVTWEGVAVEVVIEIEEWTGVGAAVAGITAALTGEGACPLLMAPLPPLPTERELAAERGRERMRETEEIHGDAGDPEALMTIAIGEGRGCTSCQPDQCLRMLTRIVSH